MEQICDENEGKKKKKKEVTMKKRFRGKPGENEREYLHEMDTFSIEMK